MKHLLILLLVAVAATGCKKKTEHYKVTGDYLVIGSWGGFTSGAPTTYYLISNGEMRADKNVSAIKPVASINDLHFDTKLSAADYESVKHVPGMVPSELLSRNGQHVGEIFVDAGYTDVMTSINGKTYRWYFEADQSGSSADVKSFVQALMTVFR